MFRSFKRKTALTAAFAFTLIGGVIIGTIGTGVVDAASLHRGNGARMACFGAQLSGNRLASTLDEMVASGEITADQQAAIEDKVSTARGVDADGCSGIGLVRDRTIGTAVLDLLGIDRLDMRAAWIDGQSLAEVAADHGVSRDELIATITDALDTRLSAAVEKGRISEEQKAEILTRVSPRIEDAIDAHIADGVDRLRERRDAESTPVSETSGNLVA